MDLIWNNEHEADFESTYGFPVMQTQLQALEKSVASVYRRDIFYIFQSLLLKAPSVKVIVWKEMSSIAIFVVSKYCDPSKVWHVSYCLGTKEFRCSCQCMESFRIPYVNVINVMVFLDFNKLPDFVVLKRWTMKVKESLATIAERLSFGNNGCYVSHVVLINDNWQELASGACQWLDEYNEIME